MINDKSFPLIYSLEKKRYPFLKPLDMFRGSF